jgi:signal peptidase
MGHTGTELTVSVVKRAFVLMDFSGRQKILTKGDNNDVDDTLLYPVGQHFVDRDEIVGVVVGYAPFLGWATIVFHEYPWLKAVGAVALLLLCLKW